MTGSNLMRVHDYLRAVASMGPFEKVAEFYSPDVVIEEFPNRIAPQGRVRRANQLSALMNKAVGYSNRKATMCSEPSKLAMRSRSSWNGGEYLPFP